ncbi:flagellar motor switch protein FliN/FliY [Clostridium moniliforme]|uniref:Flagellar motor switch protein FliN/FliY n=1 Tax=Clostridium moniliforme TaxID=39489 RepID=A0ABS4F1D7_9CLOT|nr:FliM/FliN family flagellar motor C-terminal domain-containing protein [Clostridium moniliforme]MBP1890037.1 flagellar motor switch protein FliN/FliY [Clostridium moniliforme]
MIEGKKEDLYEVEFDTLQKKEVEKFEDKGILLNSKLDISVTIGSCKKSIKEILSLKEGDVIELEKTIDEDLDININDKMIADGESLKFGNKISVRLSSLKKN